MMGYIWRFIRRFVLNTLGYCLGPIRGPIKWTEVLTWVDHRIRAYVTIQKEFNERQEQRRRRQNIENTACRVGWLNTIIMA